MKNKIALVTGGTSGVGLSIIKELSKNAYDIYFIGTNEQKGLEIETELNAFNLTNSTFVNLDLSNVKKVQEFCNSFKKEVPKLDLLANIAGVYMPKRKITNFIEHTFAVGYISAYVLSTELKELLEKSKNARIVNVAGTISTVLNFNLNFKDLNFQINYSGMKTAIATVHAKTVLTKILADKYKSKKITVNSFNPGIVKGNLMRSMPWFYQLMFKLVKTFYEKDF